MPKLIASGTRGNGRRRSSRACRPRSRSAPPRTGIRRSAWMDYPLPLAAPDRPDDDVLDRRRHLAGAGALQLLSDHLAHAGRLTASALGRAGAGIAAEDHVAP